MLYERYVAAVEHEWHRRDRHIAAREVLGQLPQLFIACDQLGSCGRKKGDLPYEIDEPGTLPALAAHIGL